jgi:hypothetical protein
MKNKIEGIQANIEELFEKWWKDSFIAKENKLSFTSGLRAVRIPYMSLVILNTGNFISSRQFDNILETITTANNDYEKLIKEFKCKTPVNYENAQVLTENGLRPITKEEIEKLSNRPDDE